jgi:hypothetical protein
MALISKRRVAGLATTSAMIATMAVAALPGATFAAAPRQCETVVTSTVTTTTAKFTATQPANAYHQWDNVWTHDYTVTVQPSGSFAGTGLQNGHDDSVTMVNWAETITGEFLDNDHDGTRDHVTYTVHRLNDNASWSLTNAPMDNTTLTNAVIMDANGNVIHTPDYVEFKVTQPVFETVTVNGETQFANHGEYVSAMGGGNVAAQKCVGMPIQAKAPKTQP